MAVEYDIYQEWDDCSKEQIAIMEMLREIHTSAIYGPVIKGGRVYVMVAYDKKFADFKRLKSLKGYKRETKPVPYWGKKRMDISFEQGATA